MSSSRGGGGGDRDRRGKGIAEDQSTRPKKSRRPTRRDILEEVSHAEAVRLQVSYNIFCILFFYT